MEIAKPDSWNTEPMPDTVAVLDYTADFTVDEFERISRGHIPKEMEDRWFIVLVGNTLNVHRSWSGYCIYQAEIDRDGDRYSIRCATANRSPDQYGQTDNAYDARLLNFLIRTLLLGDQVPFPRSSNQGE